jgi:hypothetical protein
METRFAHHLSGIRINRMPAIVSDQITVGRVDDPLEREADRLSMPVPGRQRQAVSTPRPRMDFGAVRVHTGQQAAVPARAVDALAFTVGSHIVSATVTAGTPETETACRCGGGHEDETASVYAGEDEETDTAVAGPAATTADGGDADGAPVDAGPLAGAPPACHGVNVSANLPSATLPATLIGNELGASWNMSADFTGDPNDPAICGPCGEYRQYVKGTFTKNGSTVHHDLCGTPLDPATYEEDCNTVGSRQMKYGYHSIPFPSTRFSRPDQATGFHWDGFDYPHIIGESGDELGISLQFQGALVDTCNGVSLGGSEWAVDGTATVP